MWKTRLMTAFALAVVPDSVVTTAQTPGTYATVNGISMYYEISGSGSPLVLLHGGGSTITTTFGRTLPSLSQTHRVIAVELQAHGHTADRNTPSSFQQDAADVAELLRQLHISSADFLGFSNGGHTALQLAMSHPHIVRRLVVASAFYSRDGTDAAFWQGMDHATFGSLPQVYKDAYLRIKNDSAGLLAMFNRDAQRMQAFQGWTDADISAIQAPTLIVIGDQDIVRPEHAVAMYRLLPHARLAILPGTHGSYMGEALSPDPRSKVPDLFVALVDEFLTAP